MNIHEFQAKALLASYGVPVPRGGVVSSAAEAAEWASRHSFSLYVVKAQIHAGGRGKAGGIMLTERREEVPLLVENLLGRVLITHQTGPEGKVVRKVLIEEGMQGERELYVSMMIDRDAGVPVCIVSSEGGVDIEEVTARSPDKVMTMPIDPAFGFQPFQGRQIVKRVGIPQEAVGGCVNLLGALYRFFVEKGVSLCEINPLAITREKKPFVLDAKVVFDDNELFRHEEIRQLRDQGEEDHLELEASLFGLNYVKMEGSIGCMVNGAGLAMTTMDAIKLAGGRPANFLDVGGSASQDTIKKGFQILLSDPRVRGIFINIFGGIVRCDRIGRGIVEAAKEVEIRVPLVVRLEGTNADEGRRILASSGVSIHQAHDLWEGARTIVALAHA